MNRHADELLKKYLDNTMSDKSFAKLTASLESLGENSELALEQALREEFAHIPCEIPQLKAPQSAEYPGCKYNRKERRRIERMNKRHGIPTKFY